MKQRTALVIDDDPFVGMMLVAQLKAWGWSAQAVDDGAKALELLKTRRFDTLLLDVMMPGLDGMAQRYSLCSSCKRQPM
jgi:CheY-like chemotaxis protein